MNKRRFVQLRKPAWKRFATLMDRLERGWSSSLTGRELAEFSRLFRELSGDLATVRSRRWGEQWASYLNHLVARGHNAFYRAPPGHGRHLALFLAVGFPRLFRANIGYFVMACLLFFLPGAISWSVIQQEPSLAHRVISGTMLERIESMYSDDSAEQVSGGFSEQRAFMAGFYVYNNVGIALKCFARGILLGVGTVYTLLYNGIFLGAVGGYVVSQGSGEQFLSFVISHGAFELTAIAVAGGAGLMLGNALLHPGNRTRMQALRSRGLEAVQIACGAAAMLVVAAVIEAFWSPSGVPAIWKYTVGAALWLLVILYLALAGRGE